MVKSFIDVCLQNKEKTAFKYIKNNKIVNISFEALLFDIFKLCKLFEENNLKQNDKVVLFILPSYELYILMLAGIMYGLNIVVIDDFRDRNKVKTIVNSVNANYVFVNNKTRILCKYYFGKSKSVNIEKYYKYDSSEYLSNVNEHSVVLTTFTSGTTGTPKFIERSLSDLQKQVELLYNNFNINNDDVIICMLPIYVLFSLFNGNTVCLVKKLSNKNIEILKGNVVLGKIANVLTIKEKIIGIDKLYLGGAYIYKKEVEKLLSVFCDSEINYIYGASEGVVIGINTLNDYLINKRFKIVKGINVCLDNIVNSVGEIVISGNSVLSSIDYHKTGDIGYIENEYIYIYGRNKYSSLDNGFYNYLEDEKVREEYKIDKAYTIWYQNKRVVFYKGKCNNKNFINVRKFPYDLKHKTKIDYNKLIDKYLK